MKNVLFVASAITFLCGCSNHDSSLLIQNQTPVPANVTTAVSTAIEGTWVSRCRNDDPGPGYEKYSYSEMFEFDYDSSFSYTRFSYLGLNCTRTFTVDTDDGVFSTKPASVDGSFLIEFDFHFENNHVLHDHDYQESLVSWKDSKTLSISLPTRDLGHPFPEFMSYQRPYPVGDPQTAPASDDPADVSGEVATTWSDVKFVFCNIQGSAVLLDFEGIDLSTAKNGRFSWSQRDCGALTIYKKRGYFNFSVGTDGSHFKMTIDDGDSFIQDNESGFERASALLEGNSGICTFLSNKGTKGIFDGPEYGSLSCK